MKSCTVDDTILFIPAVVFQNCTANKVDGIVIGSDLQSAIETTHYYDRIAGLIKRTLNKILKC